MIIINIFIAIIIAIGFWRNTSKEHKRMVAKASLTKTVILFLLSVAMTVFYYKSYQVARIKNLILVKGIKGSYNDGLLIIKNRSGKILKTEKTIHSNDTIKILTVLNKYTHNDLDLSDPLSVMWDSVNYSGIYYEILLDNYKKTRWYPKISKKVFLNNHKDTTHIYSLFYLTNTIPNFIPFVRNASYSKSIGNMDLENYDPNSDFYSFHFKNTNDIVNKNIDKGFVAYLFLNDTRNFHDYMGRISSSSINTLNFFSAADLSQCEYEVNIESEIPIDTFCLYFDLPIEVSSLDVIRHHINSRGFKLGVINNKKRFEKTTFVKRFHIKFPTLANLQLIRSLILITLLTALFALFFKNLYYYVRKKYEKCKRKQKTPFAYSRKMVLLWIPVGKIIIWTFIVAFAFLLFLTILNFHFRINVESVPLLIYIIVNCLLLYIIFLYCSFSFLYRKGIYFKDLKTKIINKYKEIKTIIINKYKEIKNKKEDIEPSLELEDKPEETSKIEDSTSNEISIQKDGQKSSRQSSRPQKRKPRKRRK